MGINISGIGINTNYNQNISALSSQLGLDLTFVKDLTYNEALSTPKEDNCIDVFFTKKGTVVFINDPFVIGKENSINQKVCAFGISETTMMFVLNYYENGETIREKMSYEGNIMSELGEKLKIELTTEDISEQILHITKELIGKDLFDFETTDKTKRYTYTFSKEATKLKNEDITLNENKERGNCPRCLGDGYVNQKDIKRLKMESSWLPGPCALCSSSGSIPKKNNVKKKWWQFWKKNEKSNTKIEETLISTDKHSGFKIIRPLTNKQKEKIEKSTIFLRTGQLYMHYWTDNLICTDRNNQEWQNKVLFFWKAEESFPKKSLPPSFETFKIKHFLFNADTSNLSIQVGQAMPWFGMPGLGEKHVCEINGKKITIPELNKLGKVDYIKQVNLTNDNLDILTDKENYFFLIDERLTPFKNGSFYLNEKPIPISIAYSIGGIHIITKTELE